jgi:N-acyl-phosphatidylethanolamine-hydrolysing phospholipase D
MARKRYENPHTDDEKRRVWDFILWQLGHHQDEPLTDLVPDTFSYPLPEKADPKKPLASWINHSTFLIKFEGIHLLTDPIWSERCSPVGFLGPKRTHAPAIALSRLPEIDYVLISHDHYDHLDKQTVKGLHQLFPQITWIVPQGVKRWFAKQGITNVIELSWWGTHTLSSSKHPHVNIKLSSVPAQHFSGRLSTNQNNTLWMGLVLDFQKEGAETKRLYFAGDTGYNPHDFKKIGEHFGQMDLSLLPIGAYSPRSFMAPVHVEPEHAVQIHQEVRSIKSLAGHWKTFRLSDEPINQPPYDLFLALQKRKLDPLSFLATEPGFEINW